MQASVRAITAASAGKGSAEVVEASLVEILAYMRSPMTSGHFGRSELMFRYTNNVLTRHSRTSLSPGAAAGIIGSSPCCNRSQSPKSTVDFAYFYSGWFALTGCPASTYVSRQHVPATPSPPVDSGSVTRGFAVSLYKPATLDRLIASESSLTHSLRRFRQMRRCLRCLQPR